MKIQKFISLFLILFSFQSFAQTNTGDTVGKKPSPKEGDHEVKYNELFSTLGEKLYDADKRCSDVKNRKLTDKNFVASYNTLVVFLQQKDESLQPKNSSCDENCKVGPDKVDKYFICLLNENGIKEHIKLIVFKMENEKELNQADSEIKEFLKKTLKIVETKKP